MLLTIVNIILVLREIYIIRIRTFLKELNYQPIKILYLISFLTIILIVPCRATCHAEVEDILVVLAIVCMSFNFMYFFRYFLKFFYSKCLLTIINLNHFFSYLNSSAYRAIGPFVLIIQRMVKTDMVRFFLIYAVFLMGFSQGL